MLKIEIIISTLMLSTIYMYAQKLTYPVVETGVHDFYSENELIDAPDPGEPFYGQDATYQGFEPSYTDNGDGTITDNVTGLMWQKDMGSKISYADAFNKSDTMTLGGYTDWRVPNIKELYSLILFTGRVNGMTPITFFLDSAYFNQPTGDLSIGERLIDAQTWSSTQYRGLTMNRDTAVFGVNFIDGRIKGYPKFIFSPGSGTKVANKMYFRMVRGNPSYGKNNFVNNNDGTITDNATGLMWQQADDGIPRDWENALSYAENLTLADYTDWRLPNAKELQSIVDYTRCPDITSSPAIDPIFSTTMINYPNGTVGHYPYFWSGTSHLETSNPYSQAVYIAFGEALGKMNNVIMDVHGAGAQRSDPKTGNAADYPVYMGPQGDMRVVFNHVRCVRNASGATSSVITSKEKTIVNVFPVPAGNNCYIRMENVQTSVEIKLYNYTGIKMKEFCATNASFVELDTSNLPSGIYLLFISLNKRDILMRKLVKS